MGSVESVPRPRDGNTDRINYHNTALSHTYPGDTQANLYSSEYDCQISERVPKPTSTDKLFVHILGIF